MAILLEWILLCSAWMLLVGKWSSSELWVGVFASILALIASRVLRKNRAFRFAFSAKQIAQAWRIPGYVFIGTWELLQALARQVFTKRGADSLLRAASFEPGQDDAPSKTRRAL